MRLLSSHTLDFHEFVDDQSRPRYAILSHRWEDDEVAYKDMQKRRAKGKKGFAKIQGCAKQALEDGLDYFWIDTCCIDKTSSAELSEAINSMFRWYRDAAICYVYLCDTPPAPEGSSPEYSAWEAKFTQSAWFTRGWTLQEMIAPRTLIFYTGDWAAAGDKEQFASAIEAKTGVPRNVFITGDLSNMSVAQRMSWAAHRQTTRTEDMAYCLLGIFDISMPMLYGEGSRAFLRLQQEIIRTADDMSIFCWADPNASFSTYSGLLARSPLHFATCQNTWWKPWHSSTLNSNLPFDSTNKGIRLAVELREVIERPGESIAVLEGVERPEEFGAVGLHLQQIGNGQYARVDPNLVCATLYPGHNNRRTTIFVRQNPVMENGDRLHVRAGSILLQVDSNSLRLEKVQPAKCWDDRTALFSFTRSATADATDRSFAATFTLHVISASSSDIIRITVDVTRPLSSCVQVDAGWRIMPDDIEFYGVSDPLVLKRRFRSLRWAPDQPMEVDMVFKSGIIDHESRASLTIRTI